MLGFGLLVRLAASTGLRRSELAGLQVRDIDLTRGGLSVTHTVVEVGGVLHEGDPRSYEARAVPVPAFLLRELQQQQLAGERAALRPAADAEAAIAWADRDRDLLERNGVAFLSALMS